MRDRDTTSKPPKLTWKEQDAQKTLKQCAEKVRALRYQLLHLHGELGEQPHESAMQEGMFPATVACSVRAAVECVVSDHLDPAIRSLEETAQETPKSLHAEWQRRQDAEPRPRTFADLRKGVRGVVTARHADPSDLHAAYQLGLSIPEFQALPPAPFMSWEDFHTVCMKPDSALFVAEKGGTIVGFAFVVFSEATALLRFLAVDPNSRREGVGSVLLEAVRGHLRSQQVSRVGAFVFDGGASQSFAQALLFTSGKPYRWFEGNV